MAKTSVCNVPEVRFKGVVGSWEAFRLDEITWKIGSGKTPKGGKLSYLSDGIPLLRSQNIVHDFIDYKGIVFIGDDTDEEMSNSRVLKNDVLLNITGASIGRSAVYRSDEPANVNQHVCIIRVNQQHQSDFVQLNLTSTRGQKAIALSQAGGGREGLNFQQIGRFSFKFPSRIEQAKIGTYFKELDRVIELHQHKHNKLVTLKKAMLQKMFPKDDATTPEVRFKGFTGGWSITRLGDITFPLSNNSLSRENLNKKSGLARNIHYGDILVWLGEVIDVNRNQLPFITDSLLVTKLQSSKLRDGDIIIADAAEDSTVGKTTEVLNVGSELVFAGLHTIALRPMISFAPAYLGYFMNSHSFHDQLLPIMQGTKVLSVSKTALKEMHLLYPKELEEQQKIGNYFRKLDELISQHSTQLDKLKQIKSACLEKMFV